MEEFIKGRKEEKASFLFNVSDEPGALMRVLEILYQRGLNMQKLESRPIPGKPWEYTFYVDALIPENSDFDETCKEIADSTVGFRLLGIYENGIL